MRRLMGICYVTLFIVSGLAGARGSSSTLLVDFGATAAQNQFGTGWTTVFKSSDTAYTSAGPGGLTLVSGSNDYSNYQGVQGSSRSFSYGERIVVTWYNNTGYQQSFIPLISFTDSDQPNAAPGQPQWYGMRNLSTYAYNIDNLDPGQTVQTFYDVTNATTAPAGIPPTAGSYSLVNICMNTAVHGIVIDKIELTNADITSPSIPANLQATAHPTHPDTKINLTWNASTDNVAVDHYRIYRNAVFVHTSSANSYTDTLLTPLTSYTYTIRAVDACRNISGHSDPTSRATTAFQDKAALLNPYTNLQYLGAFKLPSDTIGPTVTPWEYREGDLAYYPSGDPGNTDAYPGSLYTFGLSNPQNYGFAAEIGIPVPVISTTKNAADLNTAPTLRHFHDIKPSNLPSELGLAMGEGIEYVPPKGSQTTAKLYTIFGDNYFWDKKVSHGASELDFSTIYGAWSIGSVSDNQNPPYYTTNRYLFKAPEIWASTYTSGKILITGNARYGNYPHGPALYAIAPWQDGNPLPAPGTALSYITLLRYDDDSGTHFVDGFLQFDGNQYRGGEWLTADRKSAVIITSTKGFGEDWYGYYDGTPHEAIAYNVPFIEPDYLVYGEKGPKATSYRGIILFYNPDDLAAVASGTMQPYEPQPYATFDAEVFMYKSNSGNSRDENRIGEVGFDRDRGLLYLFENRAYGDDHSQAVIHVWKVTSLPGAAVLKQPSGSISDDTPIYTWDAVSSATWYYLWVNGPSGSPVIKQWYSAEQAGCATGTGTCAVTPATTLATGSHTWWIQTYNDAGYGPWSAGMSFAVASIPPAATLVAPSGTSCDTTPSYIWNAVSSATWYYVWVNGPSGTPVIQQWYTAAQAHCESEMGTCAIAPATALTSGSYTWWVQTRNDAGDGPWSAGQSFTVTPGSVPGAVTLIAPSGSSSNPPPYYQWYEDSCAAWYFLWVNGPSGTPVIQQWYPAAQANCNGTWCWVANAAILPAGTSTWWIQTWNSAGYGPWSAGQSFTVPASDEAPAAALYSEPTAWSFLTFSSQATFFSLRIPGSWAAATSEIPFSTSGSSFCSIAASLLGHASCQIL